MDIFSEDYAPIPDARVYYRVLFPEPDKDAIMNDAIDALRLIQGRFIDPDYTHGSITVYYHAGEGKAEGEEQEEDMPNWAQNLSIECYTFSPESGKFWASYDLQQTPTDEKITITHQSISLDSQLERLGMNPLWMPPPSELQKIVGPAGASTTIPMQSGGVDIALYGSHSISMGTSFPDDPADVAGQM